MQRRFCFPAVLPALFLSSLGLTPTSCLAAPPEASASPPSAVRRAVVTLALQAEKNLQVKNATEAIYDFGKLTIPANAIVAHIFTLRNTGTKPLRIESLLTSCHCTTAELGRAGAKSASGGDGDGSYSLAAGKSAALRVAIDTGLSHGTDLRKMVWVYVQGVDEPVLTLTVTGQLE